MLNALVMSYSRLPAGDGAGWDVAESVWQDALEDASAVGGNCGAGDGLGALPGIGIRAAGYAGHYFVWGQLDGWSL